MKNIKRNSQKHQGNKGLYYITIHTSLIGLFLSAIYFGMFFSGIRINTSENILLSRGVLVILGGLPLYYINSTKNKKQRFKRKIINQLITILIFYFIIYNVYNLL